MPRPLGIVLFAVAGYAVVVLSFETFIGFVQFEAQQPLEIITTDPDGTLHRRMLGRFEDGGHVYASAHHWPRRWYREAVAQRDIEAVIDGVRGTYRAIAIDDDAEKTRLGEAFPLPLAFRVLTGFPPRSFLRLDPIEGAD